MITRRFIRTPLVAAILAIAVSTFAQKPANAPKNATAQCKDGTFSSAKTQQGACSKHGGVKTWWGADTSGSPKATETKVHPATESSPKSETKSPAKTTAANGPENATAKCKDGTYSHAKSHSGACSHHGGVAEWYK